MGIYENDNFTGILPTIFLGPPATKKRLMNLKEDHKTEID